MADRALVMLIFAVAAAMAPVPAEGKGHSGAGAHSRRAEGVPRDRHDRIARSAKAKREFKHAHPCPATGRPSGPCPGYVIDHVRALKRGGPDTPGNMQWQTFAEARAKDRVE